MVFPLFKSMSELLIPVKQDEKRRVERGFANQEAMHRYIKLTEQMNKNLKRKKARKVLQQALKKTA